MKTLNPAIRLAGAILLAAFAVIPPSSRGAEILVEAEAFDDYGGWTLDAQFVDEMGSPYLLAHGLGKPVANAKTQVKLAEDGEYRVWVRSKDWAKGWTTGWTKDRIRSHHPGRFRILINSESLDVEFGANGKDWSWHVGGTVRLDSGTATIELKDLMGFDGRCDAIFLTTGDKLPPNTADDAARTWRKRLLGLPEEPVEAGEFDAADEPDNDRPNIIVVMADDMGFSDLGCYGSEIKTPTIDRLAKEGMRFSQFYNCALCGPSRASLMTGCYPWSVGQKRGTSIFANLTRNCATVLELLKANGYATCAVGRLDMIIGVAQGRSGWPVETDPRQET